ncbi:hypothetical protein [Anaerosporobacter sp.]|uniref:hypothetical protein n=1 Tax=Anaerosporobacter sp. TaxID=1872529 RepID=UPI00286F902D|nr:hypothetical protein [Anaerosporobacter sp.]
MWNLIKYELRKQRTSKFVIFGIVALIELFWFWQVFADGDSLQSASVWLIMVTFISMFYLYLESVVTFSQDMKTKNSYMLFMTPNSSYKIIGAKLLASGLQIIIYGLCFFGIYVADGTVAMVRFKRFSNAIEAITSILRDFVSIDINVRYLFSLLMAVLIIGICVLMLAYVSITLSATFLSNKRGQGIISVLLFIVMFYAVNEVAGMVFGNILFDEEKARILFTMYYGAIAGIAYLATAWMLDKRVSL